MFYQGMMLLAQQGIIIEREQDLEAIQDASFVFNGPQFFAALIAGVVLAFALQLLFTNLGVAAGISMAGASSGSSHVNYEDNSGGLGSTVKKIGMAVGLGTLISVSFALFIASFLAVKLGLFVAPLSGAIVGLVIWATFFALMMFFSSRAIGSLLGSVVNTATSGMQSILGTATAAIGAGAASKQVVNTAEAAAAAVRKELGMAIDPVSMRENVEDFLQTLKPAEIDIERVARDFEQLLDDENLQEIINSDRVRQIDRQTFIDLISDRTDISRKDAERIADKMASVWHKTTSKLSPPASPVGKLSNYLQTATKEQLVGTELGREINSVVNEIKSTVGSNSDSSGGNSLVSAATSFGVSSLANIAMGRTDLSDFDVDKVVRQLKSAGEQLGEKTDELAYEAGIKGHPPTTVKKDIDNYLANAYPWQLKQSNLDREFRNLIYDPAADPQAVAAELRGISRSDFVQVLKQKGLLSQAQIRSTANLLDAIRLEVIATAEAAQARAKSIELMSEVEEYLLTVNRDSLTPEKIQLEFKPILEDFDATSEQLATRLAVLDRPTLERMLELRGDMEQIEASAIAGELELARDRVLEEKQQNISQAQVVADRQWQQVQSYLRDTGKGELNPEGIKRELELLLRDPQAGSSALRSRLANFNRDTLVQLLAQRQDLSEAQIEDTIDTVESAWMKVASAPQKLAGKAQAQYDLATSEIASYLRRTGKPELNPRGIERDLTLLFNNPKLGSRAIRQRVAAMDRDTLVQLLAQRRDLSEADIEQVINDVQSTLKKIAKAPRRAALRTQAKVQDFKSSVADYLRSTDKAELNPAGIKRDIELLLNDPRAGAESLKERLSSFDRSTLTALLTQREDISPADVDQVVDQILAVRDNALSQLQLVQDKVQSVIDRLLAKIKAYLDSLDRPELAYAGIKRDINVMFDDPQAGFMALKDRFSGINRDTMIAVMSSRKDISKVDADRIITQIERTRDRTLQRAERIQTETMMRVEDAKRQAAQQVEDTRKAAATASWWLFITGLISAISSAVAGAIGVVG